MTTHRQIRDVASAGEGKGPPDVQSWQHGRVYLARGWALTGQGIQNTKAALVGCKEPGQLVGPEVLGAYGGVIGRVGA